MAILYIGALRFAGLAADVPSLPVDASLLGAIFDATDTLEKWVFDGSAWVEFVAGNPVTTKGDLFTFDTDDARLPVGTADQVLSVDAAEPTGLKWIDPPVSSPLTTKGDVYSFSTFDERLPVGTNGQVLSSDSLEVIGLKWIDPVSSPLTTKGDLFAFSTVDVRFPVGTDGQVLSADAAEVTGLKWVAQSGGAGSGITGLNPNSTILDYSTDIADYTTPVSATATSDGSLAVWGFLGDQIIEDFTTYADSAEANATWVSSDLPQVFVDVTNDLLNQIVVRNGSDDSIAFDFGSTISDTTWTLRFKHTITALTTGAGVQELIYIGSSASGSNVAQDCLGLFVNGDSTQQFGTTIGDNATPSASVANNTVVTLAVSDVRFFQLVRDGTDLIISWFSDSDYVTQLGTFTVAIAGTVTALQYVKVSNVAAGALAGTMTVELDDFQIFDGILPSQITTANDAIDGDTATFWESDAGINESITVDMGSQVNCYGLAYYLSTAELATMTETQFQIKVPESGNADAVWGILSDQTIEDFTTYADQTEADSKWVSDDVARLRANPTTDVWDFDSNTSTLDILGYYDVGTSNISDTAFVYRFKWDLTSFTQHTTGAQGNKMEITLGDNLNKGEVPNTDMIGIRLTNNQNTLNLIFAGFQSNGASATFDEMFTTATPLGTYYFEVKRLDATNCEMRIFSDAGFTNQLGTTGTPAITSATQTLRYFRHQIHTQTTNGVMAGTIDDIQLWNNVSTVPSVVSEQVLRTINKSDMLPDVYNFIRFNGVRSQFLEIEGSSGNSLVMVANELEVQTEADPPLTIKHGQFTINPTNSGLPLNGGDPTSSVIDDPATNSMTLNSTIEQADPATDAMVMWQEILDVNNSVSHSKMKIDGSIKNVRWF